MKRKYLYHGTQASNIDELKPFISLEYVAMVYATDDIAYALVRAGRQLDKIREEYYGKDEPFELAECYPDAFKDQFDCDGYIYLLDPDDFMFNPETGEYRSEKPVKPIKSIHVSNILKAMNRLTETRRRYKFVFDGDEKYWFHVRGGREGFISRKLEAKRKMLALRKGLQ